MESTSSAEPLGPEPRYPIESVDNALQLLSLFVVRDRLRVKDAADALGVAGGTAHRLLAMLQYRGYVSQDPVTKMYLPGPMLLGVGLRAAQSSDLRTIVRPHMDDLHSRLDETIQLATLHGKDVFFVEAIESTKALRVSSRAGTTHPAHCTSVGKAILAEQSREQLLQLYPTARLPRVTPSSITSRSRLLAELDDTRARGYATNFGELEDGIGSVACAVHNRDGRAVAALGAGAPLSRLEKWPLDDVADMVAKAVANIAADLRAR